MKKKIISLSLAIAMSFLVVACQKKDDAQTSTPQTTTDDSTEVNEDTTTEDEEPDKPIESTISEDKRYHTARINGVDYSLTVDLKKCDGNTSLEQIETLESLFWQVYPKLYERFGYYSSAPTDIELLIENEDYEIACAWENKVHIHDMWLHDNPEDFDCYTHELAHLTQNGWYEDYLEYDNYIETFADYCRYLYAYNNGEFNDHVWTLQTVDEEDSRETSVRFLVWLDNELSTPDHDFMYDYYVACSDATHKKDEWDKVWTSLFKGTSMEGKTIDEVWDIYAKSDFAHLSTETKEPGQSELLKKYNVRKYVLHE